MDKIAIFGLIVIVGTLFGIFGYLSYFGADDHEHDDDHIHDHSVEIEGSDMRLLSVQEVADLWEIDSEILLREIIKEFDLQEDYNVDSVLEDMRMEYAFSPALIKNMAEEIKNPGF